MQSTLCASQQFIEEMKWVAGKYVQVLFMVKPINSILCAPRLSPARRATYI